MNSVVQSLRPQLERVLRAWRGSPLPDYLYWWLDELRVLLPASLRRQLDSGAVWFVLEREPAGWRVQRAGATQPLARWSADAEPAAQRAALAAALHGTAREDLRLALGVPADAVLRHTLLLPLAARDRLRQVIAFEIDRATPFRAAQVYFAVRALERPAPAGRFAAELVAMPRARLDPLLAQAGALGVPIDAVDMLQGTARAGVNLLPPERRPRHVSARGRLNLALALAVPVLVAFALGQWLHNREQALAQMQDQVQAMHNAAQQVADLRQRLMDQAGAAGFLVRRKRDTVSVLALLADLTRRLPASAWVERLSLDNAGQLGMQGQAQQAAPLIDALKGSPLYDEVNFQGAIQRDPNTGKERFYLVAQLRQPAAATPASTRTAAGGAP